MLLSSRKQAFYLHNWCSFSIYQHVQIVSSDIISHLSCWYNTEHEEKHISAFEQDQSDVGLSQQFMTCKPAN